MINAQVILQRSSNQILLVLDYVPKPSPTLPVRLLQSKNPNHMLQKQENPHLNSPLPLIIVAFGLVPFKKVVARHRKSSKELLQGRRRQRRGG